MELRCLVEFLSTTYQSYELAEVFILTDHANLAEETLISLLRSSRVADKLNRWISSVLPQLERGRIFRLHISGRANIYADFLSRMNTLAAERDPGAAARRYSKVHAALRFMFREDPDAVDDEKSTEKTDQVDKSQAKQPLQTLDTVGAKPSDSTSFGNFTLSSITQALQLNAINDNKK